MGHIWNHHPSIGTTIRSSKLIILWYPEIVSNDHLIKANKCKCVILWYRHPHGSVEHVVFVIAACKRKNKQKHLTKTESQSRRRSNENICCNVRVMIDYWFCDCRGIGCYDCWRLGVVFVVFCDGCIFVMHVCGNMDRYVNVAQGSERTFHDLSHCLRGRAPRRELQDKKTS